MANKQILGLNAGRPGTIGTADVGVIGGDAQITGNLTVAGDIVSRGAVDVVLQDQFLELANGQTSTVAAAAGYTATISTASAITYNIASFTAPSTITLSADSDTNATFFSGSATITANLTATDTVVVQNAAAAGTTFTAVASGAGVGQFNIGADAAITAENLAASINADTNFRATAFGATVLIQLVADATTNSPTIVYTQNAGSGAVTAVNFSNNPIIPANTIIMLSNLDDTANDGIYAVASTAANTITVKASGAINSQAPFLQSAVVTGTETGNNDVNFVDLYVQAVADGAIINDSVGPVTKGTLVDNFQALASDADFAGTYTIVGAGETTLDDAYTSGNTITTTSSRDVDITLIAGTSLKVSGSSAGNGTVDFGDSGNDLADFGVGTATFDINATGAVTINGASAALDSTGQVNVLADDRIIIQMDANDAGAKALNITADNAGEGNSRVALNANHTGGGSGNAAVTVNILGSEKASFGETNLIIADGYLAQLSSTEDLGLRFGASGTIVNGILDEDAMTTDSAKQLATQQSIKAYVDSRGLANYENTVSMVANENIDFGEVVAVKISGGNEGRAILADPNVVSTSSVVGICVTAGTTGAGQTITVATSGQVAGLTNVTAGQTIYASVSTAGALQSSAPTASGDTIYQIGYGTATNEVSLQIAFVAELA